MFGFLKKSKKSTIAPSATPDIKQTKTGEKLLRLSQDKSVDVRLALVARLVELLPDLETDKHAQLYAYTVQALGVLAQDEVLKIRKALSDALKDHAGTPPDIAAKLARDVERQVSEPILRFCAALPDDDLLDILASHPQPWVISAIAGRETLRGSVVDVLVESGHDQALDILISNDGAEFTKDSLYSIIDKAKDFPAWHGKLAVRKDLSLDLARKLSGIVNESILALLKERTDFDDTTRKDVAALVARRLSYTGHDKSESAKDKLARYVQSGTLTAEVIHDAIVWGDRAFVLMSLSYLSGIPLAVATRMLDSGGAKPVIALCYQARVPMRLALSIQTDLLKFKPKDIVYAKGGTDYPLTKDEVKWQLEFFGL